MLAAIFFLCGRRNRNLELMRLISIDSKIQGIISLISPISVRLAPFCSLGVDFCERIPL